MLDVVTDLLEHASLDADSCYRAVASRDARFDGWFVTAVHTTGIYCRPSCPARTPLPRNVSLLRHGGRRAGRRVPRLPPLPARRRPRVARPGTCAPTSSPAPCG